MAGSNFLLDTNIIVAILNQEADALERLAGQGTHIPLVALGELYYGALKSARPSENVRRIDEFLVRHTLLTGDVHTAYRYSQIKLKLRQKGRPIPENDVWIAALTLQHELILVTRDEHFREVEGLTLQTW